MVPNRAALGMELHEVCRHRATAAPDRPKLRVTAMPGPVVGGVSSTPQPTEPPLEDCSPSEQPLSTPLGRQLLQLKGPLSPRAVTILHAAVVLYYIAVDIEMFTCSQKLKKTNHPVTKMFLGGVTQFFTDWNQVIHQAYFCATLAQDVLGIINAEKYASTRETLAVFRHYIFGPVLLPATCLTVVNFWGFYGVAPHLMLDDLIVFYPTIMNHVMHTFIAPLVYTELFVVPHRPLQRAIGVRHATALMASYSGWLYLIGVLTGKWPYRFLEVMNVRQHVMFVPCMFMHGYFWYFINEFIISWVWGDRNKRKKDTQK